MMLSSIQIIRLLAEARRPRRLQPNPAVYRAGGHWLRRYMVLLRLYTASEVAILRRR
jgi:hypothetical protein